ncbi:hypothetical protein VTN00DRAFT_3520 [Thermoascus crustaceus]|uniref:uncharacterized protein n=1 Tax=Thermoascus crustaceus TaxID=5088 RepID=UPI003743B9D3
MHLRPSSSLRASSASNFISKRSPHSLVSSSTINININRRIPNRPSLSPMIVTMSISTDSKSPSPPLPPLSHILETCLYVRDLPASVKFYRDNFLLEPFLESPRMSGFSLGTTTLLLFQLGQTASDTHTPSGLIPGHGPSEPITTSLLDIRAPGANDISLKQHFCLAVREPEDVARWEEHLRRRGVKVTGRMEWDRGGRSVYFEDLDGHVGEVGSRGVWGHY